MSDHYPTWIVKRAKNRQWMVTLIAGNGEPLVWSETYTLRKDAERALATILRCAVEALLPR